MDHGFVWYIRDDENNVIRMNNLEWWNHDSPRIACVPELGAASRVVYQERLVWNAVRNNNKMLIAMRIWIEWIYLRMWIVLYTFKSVLEGWMTTTSFRRVLDIHGDLGWLQALCKPTPVYLITYRMYYSIQPVTLKLVIYPVLQYTTGCDPWTPKAVSSLSREQSLHTNHQRVCPLCVATSVHPQPIFQPSLLPSHPGLRTGPHAAAENRFTFHPLR